MGTKVNPVASHDPPSRKRPSPAKSIDKSPANADVDDITVIGSVFKAPDVSRALAKYSAKEETPSLEKGKAKLDLQSYATFSASELHAGNLRRLHTSQIWRSA